MPPSQTPVSANHEPSPPPAESRHDALEVSFPARVQAETVALPEILPQENGLFGANLPFNLDAIACGQRSIEIGSGIILGLHEPTGYNVIFIIEHGSTENCWNVHIAPEIILSLGGERTVGRATVGWQIERTSSHDTLVTFYDGPRWQGTPVGVLFPNRHERPNDPAEVRSPREFKWGDLQRIVASFI